VALSREVREGEALMQIRKQSGLLVPWKASEDFMLCDLLHVSVLKFYLSLCHPLPPAALSEHTRLFLFWSSSLQQ
jgi:hypothetical protein